MPRSKDELYARVVELLGGHTTAAEIAHALGLSKRKASTILRTLKRNRVAKYLGNGVWELEPEYKADFLNKPVPPEPKTRRNDEYDAKQDEVRGHAFQFTLKLPRDISTKHRRLALEHAGIEWEVFNSPTWEGESYTLEGWRVRNTPKSITAWWPKEKSVFSEDASQALLEALFRFKEQVVRQIEAALQMSLQKANQYQIKTSAEHYALVKNGLASEYRKDKNKLYVYHDRGYLWLITDYSHMVDELETVRAGEATTDNQKVKDFFNGIKQTGITPQFVLQGFNKLTENIDTFAQQQAAYAENIKSHIKAVQQLGEGVERWNENTDKLFATIRDVRDDDITTKIIQMSAEERAKIKALLEALD